jgi:hypothetical protein
MKTMRKTPYKLYPFLIILAALTIGCQNDFLDTKVDTGLTDANIESENNALFRFANAPYSVLYLVSNGFNSVDGNLFAAVSDEAVATSSGLTESKIFTQGLLTPYNNPDDVYDACYVGIRAANYYLENFQDYKERLSKNRDTISDNGLQYHLDVANAKFFMAEAHVLRAYYYYELIKRYGAVPLVKTTLTINDNTDIARSEVSEIVNFIVSEIDQQKNLLQENWKTFDQSKAGRLTKAAALAIKLRTQMLYASPLYNTGNDLARWQAAASTANELVALGQFTLDKNYSTMFLSSNTAKSTESIWELRLNTTNALERSNYPLKTPGGNNAITPSENLVSAYEYKGTPDLSDPYLNRDPRLALSIVTNNSTWTGRPIQIFAGGTDDYTLKNVSLTGYYLKKFLNDKLDLVKDASQQRTWIIFRYGEILLNYAEAMNEAYGPDDKHGYSMSARDAVNAVRSRPGILMPAVVAANQAEMRSKIKHERRIELAFEGHRYWDLIRWKDAETVLNTKITGVVPVSVNPENTKFNYQVKDVENRVFDGSKMYLYPIPQAEISKSNGILTQNPNW